MPECWVSGVMVNEMKTLQHETGKWSGECLLLVGVNDHLVGYQTSDSASSAKFHHFALLGLACGASVTLGWLSGFKFCHPIVRSLVGVVTGLVSVNNNVMFCVVQLSGVWWSLLEHDTWYIRDTILIFSWIKTLSFPHKR